jgi:antitoxin component of RelBE/YafQ-DinJ toxin-antitoxin module
MPSPSKSQLNLSVDSVLKAQFKALCDSNGVSLAKAFESFMAESVASQKVLVSPSQSPSLSDLSPSVDLENTIKSVEASLLGK